MGSADIHDSKAQLITAFVEVMHCSDMEAEFYLESSNKDIATAISLCMDARLDSGGVNDTPALGGQALGKRHRVDDNDYYWGGRYKGSQVFIKDLPAGWLARVDMDSGRIVFEHYESGYVQHEVPPGFDDKSPSRFGIQGNTGDDNDDKELIMEDDTLLPGANESNDNGDATGNATDGTVNDAGDEMMSNAD